MDNKNHKNNFNEELNLLFEKLAESRDKGIKNIEDLKQRIAIRLDEEIARLYAKKDFIAEMWTRRGELRLQKISFLKKIFSNSLWVNLRFLASMPFIYMMIIPAIIMHVMVEIYHQVCFRIYKIPRVKAREYFIFDRQLLPYLNWFEKFNCFYCSYFNCLVSYVKEIAGRTERYWCPIKHSRKIKDPHSEYAKFVDYADGEAFRKKWDELQKF
ncbi:MAG: hypothetical protein US83_C0009G0021 [Candidatus Falkowbacteria bacterium GW2011_GWC2_38_22]|uniref:Uncharacterized protein n=1 Tax=Candidatus Falkowbacteria bacterium GW2011_GWE1_38_31 TaxID=1618638 RepID=A0A0G0JTH9_9BACT|nr:MAG: hypothetical protein US73_C0012G0021 [Candidatus Falkowbacteria bacterium GW2011_GWF2_38_1205]KKQ61115.1 MAG: hypothetical protein US83_C0009G0021 [Candidatus Falkowbacteria bacterium GW2011_GWC2_38_22]KKQ63185.1 MAG: hypothetical protein US84_C0008G0078 [Candidatus Falkowbacteria bacterium GW2011_GWF1_38_22]KKQ65380.1 MAG: hypothetical protein US87_C0008G0076 [Candidatus Falkowbacteria bacterium GW2011_GWE2_38_254]KKQ69957.1 MAG: hypothetical protein US91_C0008G0077 [Candidatus Falkowb